MADDERRSDQLNLNDLWSQEPQTDKRALISAVRANTRAGVLD